MINQLEAPQVDEQQQDGQSGDPVEQYYNYLKKAGADVPASVESFKKTLSDSASAKQYYDYVKKNGYDAPPTYDSFAKTLSPKATSISQPDYRQPVKQTVASESTGHLMQAPPMLPPGTTKDQLIKKHKQALDTLHSELTNNNDLIPGLIKGQKQQNQAGDNLTSLAERPRSDQPMTGTQQLSQQLQPNVPQPTEVSDQEIQDYATTAQTDQAAGRGFLQHVAQIKPDKAKSIQEATYLHDAMQRIAEDPAADEKGGKILANAKKIEKGDLHYNPQNGALIKPEDAWESIATGLKEKNKGFADYSLFSNASPDQAIQELEKRRAEHDPDEPIPMPENFISTLTGGIAGQPIKGMVAGKIAGAATTLIPGATEFAPSVDRLITAAVSGNDFRKLSYANNLQQIYNQLRNEGKAPEEAYHTANGQAKDASDVDAIAGGAMMYAGAKIGDVKLPNFSLSEGYGAALKTALKQGAKGIGEAGAIGLIQAAGQDIKNKLAEAKGIQTDHIGKDIGEAFKSGTLFTLGMATLAKGMGVMSGKTQTELTQYLSKAPKEAVNSELGNLLLEGHITPEEAQKAATAVEEHRILDQSIPDNVTDEARMKIQEKIKRRDYLEMQLESADAAFHPEIKEKIKAVNEDILELAKDKITRNFKEEAAVGLSNKSDKYDFVDFSEAKKFETPDAYLRDLERRGIVKIEC